MKLLKKISPRAVMYLNYISPLELRVLVRRGFVYHCTPAEILRGYDEYVISSSPDLSDIISFGDHVSLNKFFNE